VVSNSCISVGAGIFIIKYEVYKQSPFETLINKQLHESFHTVPRKTSAHKVCTGYQLAAAATSALFSSAAGM
jgi:hypothetical protein